MDKRARKILFDTHWSSQGWHRDRHQPDAEDFAYAKAKGFMFDPVCLTHDDVLARLRAAVAKLSLRHVADGFLASLSTRRLDWRSALGSFSMARWMPQHSAGGEPCEICGSHSGVVDLNVLNFERHKWGGVRHGQPVYAVQDLELFLVGARPVPTPKDLHMFRDLIARLSTVHASVTSAALHQHFPIALKANKAERDQVVAILGLCGVLCTPAHPGFGERFVPMHERRLPDRHFVDMAYPACWWRGSDGIDKSRLDAVFGHAL